MLPELARSIGAREAAVGAISASRSSPTSFANLAVQKKVADRSLFSSVHSLNAYKGSLIRAQNSLLISARNLA